MDEIIPGLWIGNLASALNVEMLKVFRIFSILSAMRGRITVNEVNFDTFPIECILILSDIYSASNPVG